MAYDRSRERRGAAFAIASHVKVATRLYPQVITSDDATELLLIFHNGLGDPVTRDAIQGVVRHLIYEGMRVTCIDGACYSIDEREGIEGAFRMGGLGTVHRMLAHLPTLGTIIDMQGRPIRMRD